jgi:hypothetical protein
MLQPKSVRENYFTLLKTDNGNKPYGYMQLIIFYVDLPEYVHTELQNM